MVTPASATVEASTSSRARPTRGPRLPAHLRCAGNRTHTAQPIPGIVEDWEYNAFGQTTAHILPDNGSGHRRRDEFTYHPAGQRPPLEERPIGGLGIHLIRQLMDTVECRRVHEHNLLTLTKRRA